jgi:hypothetical protein
LNIKFEKYDVCRRLIQPAAFRCTLCFLCHWLLLSSAYATTVYQSPEDFISSVFNEKPETKTLWLTNELAEQIKMVLGHDYHKLRLRYWTRQQRSAWILEEIGKERYITAGFLVENDSIQKTSILIFRESRGWEIKHRFFTEQFEGLQLTEKYELNRSIDNITGATLSVNAVKRLAKAALLLHQWVNKKNDTS